VSVCERETDRERERYVCVSGRGSECVCVCVRERERGGVWGLARKESKRHTMPREEVKDSRDKREAGSGHKKAVGTILTYILLRKLRYFSTSLP
jgi:hypothetical protein